MSGELGDLLLDIWYHSPWGWEHLVNREWNSDEKTRDTNHTGDGTGDHRRSIVWTGIYSEQIALPENVGETTLNPLVNDHFPKNGH